MALNGSEILIVAHLIAKRRGKAPVKVLSLGYPDLLFKPSLVDRYLAPARSQDIPIRPDSRAVAQGHGRDLSEVFFDGASFFAALGAELEIVDFADFGHGETALNLNQPIDAAAWKDRYDVIIDPGTVEHCFNAAAAMANIALMLRPGGYVYHQAAISFPNHGFYSLSPTFFVDFYATNGFDVATPYCFRLQHASTDDHGLVYPLFTIDAAKEYPNVPAGGLIGLFVARKLMSRPPVWPIQTKYQPRHQPVSPAPYIQDALRDAPQAFGGRLDDVTE